MEVGGVSGAGSAWGGIWILDCSVWALNKFNISSVRALYKLYISSKLYTSSMQALYRLHLGSIYTSSMQALYRLLFWFDRSCTPCTIEQYKLYIGSAYALSRFYISFIKARYRLYIWSIQGLSSIRTPHRPFLGSMWAAHPGPLHNTSFTLDLYMF